MLRSLFSGVSGLRNHQVRLDVISNNIANVNTVGFKGSRCNFQDALYQTMQGATAPQGGRGGMNPRQVGLGVAVGSIDSIMTQGNTESTGRNTDLAIEGDGFFVVGDDNGARYYTRAGAFTLDDAGNLVNANGLKVVGWNAGANGIDVTNGTPGFIKIVRGEEMPPHATENVSYSGNLDARAAADATSLRPAQKTVYDSLGNTHELTISFQKTGDNTWSWTAAAPAGLLVDDGSGGAASGTLTFSATGALVGVTGPGTIRVLDDPGVPGDGLGGANPITINMDFTQLTQYAAETTANALDQDGYSRGSLTEFNVDAAGVVTAYYTNGRSRPLAQVALAIFNNPEGLTRYGDTLFQESNNSGSAQVGVALTGGRGTLKPMSLEMSNVDLSQEFTNLIITQRGFQANSRVITTSDEVLQELVNLKR